MKDYIDAETLADGKVLLYLKHRFVEDRKEETIYPVLNCLRDSQVIVPMNTQISKEDEELFKNANVGDVISTKEDICLVPDILQNGDKYFFPIFSNKEQMPEDYVNHFSLINLPVVQCIEMAKNMNNISGLVLDAFTEPMVLEFAVADVILQLESNLKPEEK